MGHNSVVSGHQKSTGILWVDGLSTGPPDLRRHRSGGRNHYIKGKSPDLSGKTMGGVITGKKKLKIIPHF